MAIGAGDPVLSGDIQETRDTSASGGAGEVVALAADGTVATANSEANEFGGVVSANGNTVILTGAVVAACEAGLAEGDRVGPGNATGTSTGVFISSSGGPGLALSAEGGTWHSPDGTYDVPDGHAVIYY